MASRWTSSVLVPYSSSYSTLMVSEGSLPSLRTGTKPALEPEGHGRAEDEAARFHAHDDVDLRSPRKGSVISSMASRKAAGVADERW